MTGADDIRAWDAAAPAYVEQMGTAADSFWRRFMDLPKLEPLVADVARVLALGGRFVASILHPAFFHQEPVCEPFPHRQVTGYLAHGEWWIDSFGGHRHYHRPLEWYVERLAAAGLVVAGLAEPRTLPHHRAPEQEWSEYERWFADIPSMLAFVAVAGPHRAGASR